MMVSKVSLIPLALRESTEIRPGVRDGLSQRFNPLSPHSYPSPLIPLKGYDVVVPTVRGGLEQMQDRAVLASEVGVVEWLEPGKLGLEPLDGLLG